MIAQPRDWADLPLVLTTEQAAGLLQLHPNSVKHLCRTGQLPAVKMGNAWRINRGDLMAQLAVRSGASPYDALIRAAQRLNAKLTLDGALRAICEETALAMRLPAAWINLYDPGRDVLDYTVGHGMPDEFGQRYTPPRRALLDEYVHRYGPLLVFADVRALPDIPNARLYADLDIYTVANAPMHYQDQLIGVLSVVNFHEVRQLAPGELALLQGLASQAALAITNARLFEGLQRELAERCQAEAALSDREVLLSEAAASLRASKEQFQSLSRRLVEVQEAERKALSREMHDETAQALTGLKIGLGLLKRDWKVPDGMELRIDELRSIADDVADSLHRLAANLRPATLDRYGLIPALESYMSIYRKQTGLEIDFSVDGLGPERLPEQLETALYRVAQEALANVARHSEASRACVMLQRREDDILLIVEDDGIGFDAEEALRRGRLGLLGMRERAEMCGGTLTIESLPDQGTTVYLAVPIEQSIGAIRLRTEDQAATLTLGEGSELAGPAGAAILPEAELARAKALGDVLSDLYAQIATVNDPDQILEAAVVRAGEALGCEVGTALQLDADGWVVRHGYHMPDSMIGRRDSGEDSLAYLDYALRTQEVLVIDDTRSDPRFPPEHADKYDIRAFMFVPILVAGRFSALLAFTEHTHPRHFTPAEVEFGERLKISLSLGFENAQLHAQQRSQSEELARRVEEVQVLLNLLPAGIAIAYDPECKSIRGNPALTEMLGIAPGANTSLSAEPAERPTNFRAYRDGRPLPTEELPMQMAAGRGIVVSNQIVELQRDDGRTVVLLGSAVPLFDSGGKPRGAVGAFFDIAERRAAELEREVLLAELQEKHEELEVQAEEIRAQNEELIEALNAREAALQAESQARRTSLARASELNAVLDAVADPLVIYDASARPVRSNRAAIAAYGFDPVELSRMEEDAGDRLVARLNIRYRDGRTVPAAALPSKRAVSGESVDNEPYLFTNAVGEEIAILASARPLRLGGAVATWRDVTTLENARQDEMASRQQLEAILTSMTEGLTISDPSGNILAMNPAGLKILHFERLEDALGFFKAYGSFLEVRNPDGTPMPPEEWPLARALRGETFFDQEVIVQRHDIGWESVQNYGGAAIRDAAGNIVLAINTFRDITGYKQTAEELRHARDQLRREAESLELRIAERTAELAETAARLQTANEILHEQADLLELTYDAITVHFADSSIRFWNHGAEELFGWSRDEVLGKSIHEVLQTRFPEDRDRIYRRVTETGRWEGELLHTRRDGSQVIVASHWTAQYDAEGRLAAVMEINTDITVTRQALEAAAREHNLFRTLMDHSPDCIYVKDRDSRFITANARELALFGLGPAEDLAGKTDLDLFPRELAERYYADEREIIVTGQPMLNREEPVITADGRHIWHLSSKVPLYGAEGEIIGLIGVSRDITKRKEAEQAARQQSERLQILHDIDRAILAARAPAEIAQAAAEKVRKVMRAQAVALLLYDLQARTVEILAVDGAGAELLPIGQLQPAGEYLAAAEKLAGRPTVVPDVGAWPDDDPWRQMLLARGIRSYTGMPLMAGGQLIGSLAIGLSEAGPMTSDAADLATQIADSLAVAIYNARLYQQVRASREQLQALARRLVDGQERERRYVADQLYNEAGQVLAALKIHLSQTEDAAGSAARLTETKAIIDRVMQDLHHLAVNLRPVTLDMLGLAAALKQYAEEWGREHGVRVHFQAENLDRIRIRDDAETAVYRVVQEALTNVDQHAGASHVSIVMTLRAAVLRVTIGDDGAGFDAAFARQRGAMGLVAMEERAEAVGGRVSVESQPGHGARVVVEVPAHAP